MSVFFCRASGFYSAAINGCYDPTHEKGSDGRVLYTKRGDPSMCIEHRTGDWEVKPTSAKGGDKLLAYVMGGCDLQDCTSRRWYVWDDQWHDASGLKMATGAEALRLVGCFCTCTHYCVSPIFYDSGPQLSWL